MYQSDYLMRLIEELVSAVRRTLEREQGLRDPQESARHLDEAIGNALEMDAASVLSLAPESFASILQISGTDPHLVEYLCRSLLVASQDYQAAEEHGLANLRKEQGLELARAYGLSLTEHDIDSDALENFFSSM